jgi:hypothetical protein
VVPAEQVHEGRQGKNAEARAHGEDHDEHEEENEPVGPDEGRLAFTPSR